MQGTLVSGDCMYDVCTMHVFVAVFQLLSFRVGLGHELFIRSWDGRLVRSRLVAVALGLQTRVVTGPGRIKDFNVDRTGRIGGACW